MKARCYFCDAVIEGSGHPFKIGLREEVVCEECFVKSVNRRRVREDEKSTGDEDSG